MEYNQNDFQQNDYQVVPQNYMVLAIVATILGCCSFYGLGFILGLVAIYFASQVNPKFNAGDYAAAASNSKNARLLSFIALAAFVLGLIASLAIYYFNPELYQEQMNQMQELMDQWKKSQG